MRFWFVVALVLMLGASGAQAASSKRSRGGWPDTPAGERARQWVEAFSSGEQAMRAFLERHLASESKSQRSLPKRIESYRKLRDRFGRLVLGSVEDSAREKLRVSLLAEDASVHTFEFRVEPKPPHKLLSVGLHERGHGHGHGGGHH